MKTISTTIWRGIPLLAAFCVGRAAAVDGMIPNRFYQESEVLTAISPQLSELHFNQPSVYNGYAVFAGNGVHQVWDIANPYSPVLRATMASNHRFGEAESHQVTYARRSDGTTYMATISGRGVDVWNVTDVLNPALVGEIQLPGINYGDVTGGIWGVSWQGNHLYAGATTFGLYVLDVSDPTAPTHVATLSRAALGGVPAGPVFAMGPTLVVTTPKGFAGIATVDISNPEAPRLLDSVLPVNGGSYIGGFYGGNSFLITPWRAYDVTSDPSNIQLLGQSNVPPFGEYVSFANHQLYYGSIRGGGQGIYKYDLSNPASPVFLGRFVGRGGGYDDQFSCPVGNLLVVADDQLGENGTYAGGQIVVNNAVPDTIPPSVLKVFPADGSVGRRVETCVALSLSEWPELATVDASTCLVRPVGGEPISGTWSNTTTVLNFGPDESLLPYTEYEIVLPEGGLKDFVGNGIASTFRSKFRTGAPSVGGFPGNASITPVAPTPLGQITSFSLSGDAEVGTDYEWIFGDGSSGIGAAVTHTYSAPGRYPIRLEINPDLSAVNFFEAESAALTGGVATVSANGGYSGTGYADFPGGTGSGVAVTWTVTSAAATHAYLSFRYANGGGANRPLNLVVNGGSPVTLPFPSLGGWGTYVDQATAIPYPLPAGESTITLVANSGSVGGNIDRMDLVFLDPDEAENAILEGNLVAATNDAGYTGLGFVDFTGEGSETRIRWNFTASGLPVPLTFRYANGTESTRRLNLIVDGGTPELLSFMPTGGWANWAEISSATLNLSSGSHVVELVCDAGTPGPNIDSLLLPLQMAPPTSVSFTHIVHRPLTSAFPSQSRPLALDKSRNSLWVVNPDNDTVTRLNAGDLAKTGEYPVGDHPENLAVAPDESIWVVNQGSAEITRLLSDGTSAPAIFLPPASRPYGLVFSPDGSEAYVSLEALGRIVRLDGTTGAILGSLDLPLDADGIQPQPRGLALDSTGARLLVTRFISPDSGGQVFEVETSGFSLVRIFSLAVDPGPDSSNSSRGIANYLSSVAISPDGTRAWLPSKKDNIFRGTLRDGNGLTHDQTVRSITSVLDLGAQTDLPLERIDYDNRDRAHGVDFSTLGDLAFVTQPGNNQVEVMDTYSGASLTQLTVGKAPTGILFDAVNQRLFVLNFLSRSVSGFDMSEIVNATGDTASELAPPASLVATETLDPQVLLGKQLFHDATSIRLNEEAYMSCASCHLDGSHDGRTWDLTGFGEGLRNTIDLRGRAGTAHGRLHWSANFDEVHDFEGQIRDLGAGLGLMESADFSAGTRSEPLGDPKAGISSDLDALAAYVASLGAVPASPWRQQDGSLTPDAVAGREIYNRLSCFTCHGGEHFTDSPMAALHDVGTMKNSSGQRLGQPLPGIDTPTLRGVWATPPYLHDGSAPTLKAVLTSANPGDLHGETSQLSEIEVARLVEYLRQLDESNEPALPSTGFGIPTYAKFLQQHSATGGHHVDEDGDLVTNLFEYALGASNPLDRSSANPMKSAAGMAGGVFGYRITFLRRAGGSWERGFYQSGDLTYLPLASTDLERWDPAVSVGNPPGLDLPPAGYEWVTFALPSDGPDFARGYLKLGMDVGD